MKTSLRLNSNAAPLLLCLGTGVFLWLLLSLGHDYVPYVRLPSLRTGDAADAAGSGPDSSATDAVVPEQTLITDTTNPPPPARENIPNTVHYVYILANATHGDFSFAFSEVLSIYAASKYWQPDAIYLHTNAPDAALERARSGAAGKWTALLFAVPNLHIAAATVPTHAANGKEIHLMEHKSDFVRVAALREHGGAYLDFDVHPLRSVRALLESGFAAVAGRQQGDNAEVNSGAFFTKPHSRMIELWSEGMHAAFTGEWSAHSNGALTAVCENLVAAAPGAEVLIMERNAFAPGSWMREETIGLLEVHEEEPSSWAMRGADGSLPRYEEEPMTRWTAPAKGRDRPEWAQDWSKTYMLHAFNHNQKDFEIPGFDRITPRYILERRSNMARAVYPVARELYEQGLIDIDDPYKFNVEE
ncbi:glycosyl transferase [Cordyceps fumosorosea ARSEF 2679]|uniref:Glycosyl transferase n=1 Tax=Cordyceps fumosorosea (strain ARSEF 2679) TaxID=1081104 RepID=A0A162J5D7_CORFA|nr:glycosyl transferase [Cordyceps fumosorosea ARSEF 2679]OAA63972.1 glycosyl transferase [Cordyceps fumosorosea ARSEF 2679]